MSSMPFSKIRGGLLSIQSNNTKFRERLQELSTINDKVTKQAGLLHDRMTEFENEVFPTLCTAATSAKDDPVKFKSAVEKCEVMRENLLKVQGEIAEAKQDVIAMKSATQSVDIDVEAIKTGILDVRLNISSLKNVIESLPDTLEDLDEDASKTLQAEIQLVTSSIANIEEDVDDMEDELTEFQKFMKAKADEAYMRFVAIKIQTIKIQTKKIQRISARIKARKCDRNLRKTNLHLRLLQTGKKMIARHQQTSHMHSGFSVSS